MTSPEGLVAALKVVPAGTDGIAVLAPHERPPDADGLPGAGTPVPDDVLAAVLAAPGVRADVVARARLLLRSSSWCRAEEVAAELVDCYVARRLP